MTLNISNYFNMKKLFILSIMSLGIIVCNAQSYKEAKEAFDSEDYKTALTIAEQVTDCNDSKILLGDLYIDGLGMAHADFSKALGYYTDAANNNSAEAQFIIGNLYYSGRGVQQSFTTAIEWYSKAALNGHIESQTKLGEMYYRGKGIPRDYVKAAEWFTMAAENNDAKAMFFLGGMYNSNDKGVKINTLKMAELWKKSAALGYPDAEFYLGQIYLIGRGGIQKNADSAMIWIDKAAQDGSIDALFYMGERALASGDKEKAVEYYQKAADKGLQKAQLKLDAINNGQ